MKLSAVAAAFYGQLKRLGAPPDMGVS